MPILRPLPGEHILLPRGRAAWLDACDAELQRSCVACHVRVKFYREEGETLTVNVYRFPVRYEGFTVASLENTASQPAIILPDARGTVEVFVENKRSGALRTQYGDAKALTLVPQQPRSNVDTGLKPARVALARAASGKAMSKSVSK